MRQSLALMCILFFMTGCILPHVETYRPVDSKVSHATIRDANTGQTLSDTQVILVLHRQSDYVPDSIGDPKRPRIVVEKFEHLGKQSYLEGGLWVWPFAFGTLYAGRDIFIYHEGYEPLAFNEHLNKDMKMEYPETVQLVPCDRNKAKEMAIAMAVKKIWKDEWKGYATEILEKKLP